MPYSALAVTQWFLAGRSSFGFLGYERASKSFSPDSFQQDLRGQNHIVTGGNAGLGLATATALANMNATVHLVCRDKARGEEALQKITSTSGTGGSVWCTCQVINQENVWRGIMFLCAINSLHATCFTVQKSCVGCIIMRLMVWRASFHVSEF